MTKWHKFSEELPPEGVEVIAYNMKWVDKDYNKNGVRVGFLNDGEFVSAFYWDYQDDYIAISKNRCEDNEDFFERHIDNTEPEYWLEMPLNPDIENEISNIQR